MDDLSQEPVPPWLNSRGIEPQSPSPLRNHLGTRLRDQARLRAPGIIAFYSRHVSSRLSGDDRARELAEWVRRGEELVERTGMHGIQFDRSGTWVDDGDGSLWLYRGGVRTPTLWLEYGVRYEQAEIDALATALPPGGTLVDVGANIGLHSIQLARRIDGLEVIACEPVGDTFEILQRNLAKNGLTNRIHPLRVALSATGGELQLTTGLQYENFVVPEGAPVSGGAIERVTSEPLDAVVARFDRHVDAIKCDVEGAELGVLEGGTDTLRSHRPTILVEIDGRLTRRYGNRPEDVFDLLRAHEYRYERFVGEQRLPASDSLATDLQTSSNFLFTPV